MNIDRLPNAFNTINSKQPPRLNQPFPVQRDPPQVLSVEMPEKITRGKRKGDYHEELQW